MKTIYSPQHRLRDPKTELSSGQLVSPFECPARADLIVMEIQRRQLGPIEAPVSHGLAPIARIHSTDYLDFLASCWSEWKAAGHEGEAMASTWPSRAMPCDRPPRNIEGRIGYYALAAETSIDEGTWAAAQISADVALTAQREVADGSTAAFALCRPPGHHAATDMFGGYCFINNAAVAAQAFLDGGGSRVAILDVDVHHGNGTQQIFYSRDDILTLSIHGDPEDTFPYFLGRRDERGTGRGEGFNVNYPLPSGTAYDRWSEALDDALAQISTYNPDAMIVSLGVDTFEKDPISPFRLRTEDFLHYGEKLARLRRPTVFVMEGGYALEDIGPNTVNVLAGFEAADLV
ncbi:MAG: histone deacetylase family protein [Myxococcota bacterium]